MNAPDTKQNLTTGTPQTLSEKLGRGDLMAAACPSREVLKHLTSRWGVLILITLLTGTQRFSDLRRRIGGVSERMLAQTLQWLEYDGMVERKAYKVVPPHVEYSLTPLGLQAAERVRELADWIELNLPTIMQHPQRREASSANEEKSPEQTRTKNIEDRPVDI